MSTIGSGRVVAVLSIVCLSICAQLISFADSGREIFSSHQNKLNSRNTRITSYAESIAAANALHPKSGIPGMLGSSVESLVLSTGCYTKVPVTGNQMISVGIAEPVHLQDDALQDGPDRSYVSMEGMAFAPGSGIYLPGEILSDVFDRAINQSGVVEADSIETANGKIELIPEKKDSRIK